MTQYHTITLSKQSCSWTNEAWDFIICLCHCGLIHFPRITSNIRASNKSATYQRLCRSDLLDKREEHLDIAWNLRERKERWRLFRLGSEHHWCKNITPLLLTLQEFLTQLKILGPIKTQSCHNVHFALFHIKPLPKYCVRNICTLIIPRKTTKNIYNYKKQQFLSTNLMLQCKFSQSENQSGPVSCSSVMWNCYVALTYVAFMLWCHCFINVLVSNSWNRLDYKWSEKVFFHNQT